MRTSRASGRVAAGITSEPDWQRALGVRPSVSAAFRHSSIVWQITLRADSAPMAATISLNRSRFSPA